jgi:hypothetical protein
MLLGLRLYKSTAIATIKLMSIVISVVLILNLYFQTYNDTVFMEKGLSGFNDVIKFNLFYPEEFITYLLFILTPTMYYGFIRGVSFHENGVIINKGLPFFNSMIFYKEIESYEVIHPKFFMSIKHKLTEDEILFSINSVDRVVAILDQQGISGDLGGKATTDFNTHKKLILFFLMSGIVVGLIQYSGIVRSLFR